MPQGALKEQARRRYRLSLARAQKLSQISNWETLDGATMCANVIASKLLSAISGLAFALLSMSEAGATSYSYQGSPFSDGSYITAVAELTCSEPCAPGLYYYQNPELSKQITQLRLNVFTATGALLFSVSTPTASNFGFIPELYLEAGVVSSWFLLLADFSTTPIRIVDTLGYNGSGPNLVAAYGVQSGWAYGVIDQTGVGLSGAWVAAPLPTALSLFASCLALLGFAGWRRATA